MYTRRFWSFFATILVLASFSNTTWAQPVVNLGDDASVCVGTTLDAGNAGATYIWSTGDTSQTIFADTSGTYWVDVADGTGTTRDSINLIVVPSPTLLGLKDTNLCGGDLDLIPDVFSSDRLVWFDSASGGSIVHVGDTLSGTFTDSSSYYLSAVNLDTSITVGASPGGTVFTNTRSGVRFDAFQPFLLESVTVDLTGPATFSIYRTNDRGRIIDSVVVSAVPGPNGTAEIPLFLEIPAGNNLQLLAGNFQQGSLSYRSSGVAYPYTIPDIVRIERGITVSVWYFYFFDWKVSTLTCATPRQQYNVNVLPTPTVDLGPDTIVCGGPYLLDATFPNATYAWGTGQATPTLSVDTLNTYSVEVSLGNCKATDTVSVEFVEAPGTPIVNDTIICGPTNVPLTSTVVGSGNIRWYDALVGGKLIGVEGSGLNVDVAQDTIVYAAARTALLHPFRVGLNQVPSGYFNQQRGLQFDVDEFMTIESVTMYASAPTSFTIYLQDRSGQKLDSVQTSSPAIIGPGIPFEVPLGFEVMPGERYQIIGANIQGGSLGIVNPISSFPLEYPGVMSITQGVFIASAYYYFFDWKIAKAACEGARVPKRIDVALPLNLPETLYSCGDTIIRSNIQAASFTWNTGDLTADLPVDSSGTYILTVSDGQNCTISDTTEFSIAAPVGLGDDGQFCGNELTTNYGLEATFLWNTNDTTPSITVITPGQYYVTINEPRGCVLTDTINVSAFASFPVVDLGRDRSTCIRDTLDAGNPGASYMWSNSDTTQTSVVTATGFYSVSVTNAAGCTSFDTIAVTITPKPTANFFLNTLTGFNACFRNSSTFGDYTWDFGDGGSSTVIQPCHMYIDTGTFTVTLIVINQCGSDTMTQEVRVTSPNGVADALESLDLQCYPNPATQQVYLQLGSALEGEEATFELMTLQGKTLHHGRIIDSSPMALPLEGIVSGMYMIRVRQDNRQAIVKLQVMK